jgi:hypothetical protein
VTPEIVPLEVYEASASKAMPLKLLTYADMSVLPEPEWLIRGLVQRCSTALMFGKSNSFKSFLAIDLGLSVAAGSAWHGHEVSQGNVLFVATEGANAVGRRRIPAWFEAKGIPVDNRRAFLFPQEIRLDIHAEVASLIEAMKRQGSFSLVVLDIFGGTMAGSEIEDRTARNWVHGIQRILRETGASVLTVAHTGWQDDTRARMHTHFWGSFDTRIKVEGDKAALTAKMAIERHKDADSSGAWGFRLEAAAGSLVPVLDAAVSMKSGTKLTTAQRIALQSLDDALLADGAPRTGKDWPVNTKIVTIDQWRVHFYKHNVGDTSDAKRKAFHRVRQTLQDKAQIRMYDDCVWRCFDA